MQDIDDNGVQITMLPSGTILPYTGGRFTWSGKTYTTHGLTQDGMQVVETGKTEPQFLPARSRRIALQINRIARATAAAAAP